MSHDLHVPAWGVYMTDPPHVTRYCGPEADAVMWRGKMDRTRFTVNVFNVNGGLLDVNIAQANALAEMIADAS